MIKVWAKPEIFAIVLAFFLSALPFAFEARGEAVAPQLWIKGQDRCLTGIYEQPHGPMAILLFCEDALGDYLGVVYYEHMGAPVPLDFLRKLSDAEKETFYSTWSLANRMWQDPTWASDVTSFTWSPDGKKLYVTTSDIYGSGAFYELDLLRRKYRQIAPVEKVATLNDPGPGYIITRIQESKLFYKLAPWEKNQPKGQATEEQFIETAK